MTVAKPMPVATMIPVRDEQQRPQRTVAVQAEREGEHRRPEQRAGDDRADLHRREAEAGEVLREQDADEAVGEARGSHGR